jgi:hypothetical protein
MFASILIAIAALSAPRVVPNVTIDSRDVDGLWEVCTELQSTRQCTIADGPDSVTAMQNARAEHGIPYTISLSAHALGGVK